MVASIQWNKEAPYGGTPGQVCLVCSTSKMLLPVGEFSNRNHANTTATKATSAAVETTATTLKNIFVAFFLKSHKCCELKNITKQQKKKEKEIVDFLKNKGIY